MNVTRIGRFAVATWPLALLASMCVAGPVAAAGSRVVIARDAERADPVIDRAEVRLTAELRAAGFDVEQRPLDGDDARKLVEQPFSDAPFATVLLRRVGVGAATDVWVADHVSHKTVIRRIVAEGPEGGADRALALRVVELMRASLVEAILLPTAEPGSLAAPDVAVWTRKALPLLSPDEAAQTHVLLGVGIAGVVASPEVGLAVAPEIDVAWRAGALWSVHALAAGPAFGGRVQGAHENATVRQELALIELDVEPLRRRWASAFASIGTGVYHIDVRGEGATSNAPSRDDAWCLLGATGGGARLRISAAATLVVGARLLAALPRPVVFVESQRVATAMRPGFLGELTLLVGL